MVEIHLNRRMLIGSLRNQEISRGEAVTQEKLEQRTKGIYVGAPACFSLEIECRLISEAFGGYGCYVVGSALERPDWRDVDVRYILSDEEFAKLFPDAGDHWEHDARWLLLITSISERMSRITGLPIDFQIQPQTHANERHKGLRNAVGLKIG
jgi:hypothetical protein